MKKPKRPKAYSPTDPEIVEAAKHDYVLAWMLKNDAEITRENYLDLAYLGDPPEPLGGEEEAELPDIFREIDYVD